MVRRFAGAMLCLLFLLGAPPVRADSAADPGAADPARPAPLSPAQAALFATPHLANVTRPETLDYAFRQLGPGGFTDRVSVTVADIHPDGTKDLRFDFLSGDRHVTYPGIASFTGNPLLMLFLEHDVRQMHDQTGMAAAYFRERLRQSFLDDATVSDGTAQLGDRTVPARTVTVRPFHSDPRLGRVMVIRDKTYTFVTSPDVPGGLVSLRADAPPDPSVVPPRSAAP